MAANSLVVALLLFAGIAPTNASATGSRQSQWLFFETATGLPADLDEGTSTFGLAEDALPAKMCESAEPFYCFSSSLGFEFALPKEFESQRKWRHGQRVYCVVGLAPDINGTGVSDDSVVIRSRIGATCDDDKIYDQSYIYSRRNGLRVVTLTKNGRPRFQLISIDKQGFPFSTADLPSKDP